VPDVTAVLPSFFAAREKLFAVALLLAATAAFGVGNVAHKSTLSDLDPWMILAFRAGIAIVILVPFAAFELRALGPHRMEFAGLVVHPVLGFTLGIVLQSLGALHTSATNLGFLINLSAIFTPLLCILSGQCGLKLSIIAACILSLAGTTLLGNGMPGSLGLGEWYCIGAALGYSWWIFNLQPVTSRFHCAALLTCLQWFPAAVISLLMSPSMLTHTPTISEKTIFELAFLGIGASALAFLAAACAQAKLSPVAAAIIYSAEAVFGAVAAALWLNESLATSGFIGASFILVGILVVSIPMQVPALKRAAAK
jgi:drug/metabolite transporter (DMT)-like permease